MAQDDLVAVLRTNPNRWYNSKDFAEIFQVRENNIMNNIVKLKSIPNIQFKRTYINTLSGRRLKTFLRWKPL
jgi:hypothetical protein